MSILRAHTPPKGSRFSLVHKISQDCTAPNNFNPSRAESTRGQGLTSSQEAKSWCRGSSMECSRSLISTAASFPSKTMPGHGQQCHGCWREPFHHRSLTINEDKIKKGMQVSTADVIFHDWYPYIYEVNIRSLMPEQVQRCNRVSLVRSTQGQIVWARATLKPWILRQSMLGRLT
eukprot:283778-Amphidinium_carterae.1